MTHTPGPWCVTTENISGRRVFMPDDAVEIRGKDGRGLIACLYEQNWTGTQDADNARLIAAAPDMLAALTELIADLDDAGITSAATIVRARQAIAKAEDAS